MASGTKAALARNASDHELQGHLAAARKSLDRAMDVCRRVARSRDPELAPLRLRAKAQEVSLRAVLSQINSLGYLDSGVSSDPDLTPESSKVPPARARREAAEQKRREQRREDQKVMERLGWAE